LFSEKTKQKKRKQAFVFPPLIFSILPIVIFGEREVLQLKSKKKNKKEQKKETILSFSPSDFLNFPL